MESPDERAAAGTAGTLARLGSAQALSQLGDQINRLALVAMWWAGTEPAAGELLRFLVIASLPALVLGMLAGPLADRFPSRRLLVGADLVRAVLVVSFPLLVDRVGSSWIVYALFPVVLGCNRLFRIARGRLLPEWVASERVPRANALLAGVDRTSEILGALLAGVLVASFGWRWGFVLDAATYLGSALILLGLPRGQRRAMNAGRREKPGEGPAPSRAPAGSRLVATAWCVVAGAIGVLAGAALPLFLERLPLLARSAPSIAGGLTASIAAGAVAGAALLARTRVSTGLLLLALPFVGAFAGAALRTSSPLLLFAVAFGAGFVSALALVTSETRIQTTVPRARLAAWLSARETAEKGGFVAGVAGTTLLLRSGTVPLSALGALAAAGGAVAAALFFAGSVRSGDSAGYVILAFHRVLGLLSRVLPFGAVARLASRLGESALPWHRGAMRAARANQRVLGVEAAPRTLLASYARYHAEMAAIAAGRLESLATEVTIVGWEAVEAARREGRGIVFLTAHIGNWDLLAAVLSRRCDRGPGMIWVERLRPRALFDHYSALRRRAGLEVACGAFGFREALRVLGRGGCVGFAADRVQDGASTPVMLPGGRFDLPLGPYRLARRANAALIPAVLVREGGRYVLEISPALDAPPMEDGQARDALLARAFSEHVRRWIRNSPEQWLLFSPIAADA